MPLHQNLKHRVQAAEVLLPCPDLDATLSFFTDELGFRIDAIYPADDPSVAVISAHGLRIRLDAAADAAPGVLRLLCREPENAAELIAPNGTRIELADADPPLALPPLRQSFVISRASDSAQWHVGRAGMRYRDLIPERQGGRFIASHIQIPDAGPVPDYVHYHKIRFQMIYCYKGWVRLVYEDQGEPFVMRAGDCVLQPPRIRHRVLESSAGLEVIEIGCPAEHETCADHELGLPTPDARPARDFGGQRFVFHQAAAAQWRPWYIEGFEARDTGIARATDGLAGVRVARPVDLQALQQAPYYSHDGEFFFLFVLSGRLTLRCEERDEQPLAAGDCCVLPARFNYALADCSDDLELLEVSLPG